MENSTEKFERSVVEILEFDNENGSNGTDPKFEQFAFTEEARIEAIVYGILFVFAVTGNLPVFISLLRIRRRKSRIQKMILHLTIADLIVTFVMIPLEISWRITVEWIAGDLLCRMLLFMRAFGLYLSSMVLICISIDRYSAIVHPLRVHDAQRRTNIMLYIAWITSFVCSIPQSIIFHVESHPVQKNFDQCVSFNVFGSEYQRVIYNLFCVMLIYGVPLIVIVFCYSRIMWEIRLRSRRTNKDSCLLSSSTRESKCVEMRLSDITQIKRARSNTLKMTAIIILTFICCWTPYVVIDLWYLFDSRSAEALNSSLQSSLFMFAITNSCVNPLVYGNYMFSYKTLVSNLCHIPLLRRLTNRQASLVLTRTSHVQRAQANVCIPPLLEGNQYRHYAAKEIHLELRRSSPVRRPLNPRRYQNYEENENRDIFSCAKSVCNHPQSTSSPCSKRKIFTLS